jgi:hypothetical protein
LLERLHDRPDTVWAEQCVEVIRSSYDLHFPLDRRPLEDLGYRVFWKHRERLRSYARGEQETHRRCFEAFAALAEALKLNLPYILEHGVGDPSAPPA